MKLDPIWQPATQQQMFRALMEAMSRPGRVEDLGLWTNGDSGTALARRSVLATLLDAEVSLCDHHGLLDPGDWPLLQTTPAPAERANYVLCDGGRPPDFEPSLGTLSCPDQAATLLLSVAGLAWEDPGQDSVTLQLSGPGVDGSERLTVAGLDPAWLSARDDWNAAFPLGVDLILADSRQVAGLPRTTHVEVM